MPVFPPGYPIRIIGGTLDRWQGKSVLTALFVPSSILLGMLIAVALNRKIKFIGFYRTCIFVPYVASAAQ